MSLIASVLQMSLVELLLATGSVIMNLLIIPTLNEKDSAVPRTQSVLSAVVLLVLFVVPYTMLGFYVSASVNVIGVTLWSLVAIYRAPTRSKTASQSATEMTASNTNSQPAD